MYTSSPSHTSGEHQAHGRPLPAVFVVFREGVWCVGDQLDRDFAFYLARYGRGVDRGGKGKDHSDGKLRREHLDEEARRRDIGTYSDVDKPSLDRPRRLAALLHCVQATGNLPPIFLVVLLAPVDMSGLQQQLQGVVFERRGGDKLRRSDRHNLHQAYLELAQREPR